MTNKVYEWSLTGFLTLVFLATKVASLASKTWNRTVEAVGFGWYWLRTHLWDRYHIINLKGVDGYAWGWLETDDKILMAAFTCLKEFVEEQEPDIGLGPQTPDEFWPDYDWPGGDQERAMVQATIDRHKEVRALYNWWTIERPALYNEIHSIDLAPNGGMSALCPETGRLMWSEPTWELDSILQEKYNSQEEKMFERLLAIRKSLWT